MSPLLFSMLLAACFTPNDATPGWKQVTLPPQSSSLAAPAGIDQFRPGEPAKAFELNPSRFEGVESYDEGSTTFSFNVAPDSRRLELSFHEPLRGAKVDASLFVGSRQYPLLDEKRVKSEQLVLEWQIPEAARLVVRVHQHFRKRPLMTRWLLVRDLVVANEPTISGNFKVEQSLYYRQPPGVPVELCDAPGRVLELDLRQLPASAQPRSVQLTRKN